MNYTEVTLLEKRWVESQRSRPTQQARKLPLDALVIAPQVFQGRMTSVSGDLQENHTLLDTRGLLAIGAP
jgi:hypothetical protein